MIFRLMSLYFFVAVILAIYLGASVWKKNGSSYLRMLVPLTLLMSIYIYGYSQEISVTTYERAYFWNTFQYLAIPLTSSVWLHLGLVFTGLNKKYVKVKMVALYSIPVISIVLRLTNPLHDLYFSKVYGMMLDQRFVLIQDKGPWYYVQVVYAILILLITISVYIYAYRNRLSINIPIIRYMAGATILSTLALILKSIDLFELHVDYIAIVMPLNVCALLIAIYRYDFFGVKELALEQAFDSSKDCMILTDNYLSVLDYNTEAVEFFKRLGIRLGKRNIQDMIGDHETIYKALVESEDQTVKLDLMGNPQYYSIQSNGIHDDRNRVHGKLFVIRNVTKEQELHEKLLYNATTDYLSGLLNRRIFVESSKEAYKNKSGYALGMIDIDHFKKVNDTYGHGAGDKVIAKVGKLLKDFFDEDDIIGRIGGEEFAVMTQQDNPKMIYDKMEGFRRLMDDHIFEFDNQRIHVTISIGVALSKASHSYEQMMIEADKALYKAKENGRNRVCHI